MSLLSELVERVKKETDPNDVGMILCHNGVVRGTSRAGEPASYLDISVDEEALDQVVQEMQNEKGIAAVHVHIYTGRRKVGDDVMLVVVAGDIRENVFPVLEKGVNRLKSEVVRKHEEINKQG